MLLVPNTASTQLMQKSSLTSLPRPGWSSEKEMFLYRQEPYKLTNFNAMEGLLTVVLDLLLRNLVILYSYIGERHLGVTDLSFIFFL